MSRDPRKTRGPMIEKRSSEDERVLMELEVELEGLKALMSRNEVYGNKLRWSISRVCERQKENQ